MPAACRRPFFAGQAEPAQALGRSECRRGRRQLVALPRPVFVALALAAAAGFGPSSAPGSHGVPRAVTLRGAHAQVPPTPTAGAAEVPGLISSWTARYGRPLPLPRAEGAISLALGQSGVWLATETAASRHAGGVWTLPEAIADGGRTFALAPVGAELWAFGFEGTAWRRSTSGEWRAWPPPTVADLYAAAARGVDDVWAGGYDYESERGVLVHWDGAELREVTWDELRYRQLTALGRAPDGALWAGGCNVDAEDRAPLLLYLAPGSEEWEERAVPLSAGCVYGFAFGVGEGSPFGLAAAGTDLLRWDGSEWHAEGVAPPMLEEGIPESPDAPDAVEGLRWMRVAVAEPGWSSAGPDEPAPGGGRAGPEGWAVAGMPTWRGFNSGQQPWRRDPATGTWQAMPIDDRGLLAAFGPEHEPGSAAGLTPLDLASDGVRAWAVTRASDPASRFVDLAALVALDGAARLSHPLMVEVTGVAANGAARGGTTVALGARRSAPPLLSRDGGDWIASAELAYEELSGAHTAVDLAGPEAGWALRLERGPGGGTDGRGTPRAWRLGAEGWSAAQVPTGTLQVRSLPDGNAWARVGPGELQLLDGATGVPVPGAPELPRVEPDCSKVLVGEGCGISAAPFDAAGTPERMVGWVAGRDGRMYRSEGGGIEAAADGVRGQVIDLQMVSPNSGWAIAIDRSSVLPRRNSGVLLRLERTAWTEEGGTGLATVRGRIVDVEWHLLAPVDPREAWTYGTATLAGGEVAILVRWLVGRAPVVYFDCPIGGLAAMRTDGGSQAWLLGASGERGCVPFDGRRPLHHLRPEGAGRPLLPSVGILSLSRVADESFIPWSSR